MHCIQRRWAWFTSWLLLIDEGLYKLWLLSPGSLWALSTWFFVRILGFLRSLPNGYRTFFQMATRNNIWRWHGRWVQWASAAWGEPLPHFYHDHGWVLGCLSHPSPSSNQNSGLRGGKSPIDSKVVGSGKKKMLIAFSDFDGLVYQHHGPNKTIINSAYHCSVLYWLPFSNIWEGNYQRKWRMGGSSVRIALVLTPAEKQKHLWSPRALSHSFTPIFTRSGTLQHLAVPPVEEEDAWAPV